MPIHSRPSPFEDGLEYDCNNADIAADNMAAHIFACESKPKESTDKNDVMLNNAESGTDDDAPTSPKASGVEAAELSMAELSINREAATQEMEY